MVINMAYFNKRTYKLSINFLIFDIKAVSKLLMKALKHKN